jgi:hypothetical protein
MADALTRFIGTVGHKISDVMTGLASIIWGPQPEGKEENGLVSLYIYS